MEKMTPRLTVQGGESGQVSAPVPSAHGVHGGHRLDHLSDAVMDFRREGDVAPGHRKAVGSRDYVIGILVHGRAAALAILLHAALLLLGFWLGGAMGVTRARNLPRLISVSLEHWPSGEEAGKQNQVLPGKSALLPATAAGRNRVSAAVVAGRGVSGENLSQESGGGAPAGNRLEQPAAGGGSLLSQAAPGPGSATAEGTKQGVAAEVLASPLYGVNPPPSYPRLAIRLGKQGVVLLEVFVSASGRVEEVRVATGSGHGILDEAALETVRGWRFAPGLRNGRPVAMRVRVPVRFELRG
jgi:protein TonB